MAREGDVNDQKTDAQIVAGLRQTIESCRAHYVGDWEMTSLHCAAVDLLLLVELAELALRMRLVTVEDERSYLVLRDERGNQWPVPWPTDTDPDTRRLAFDQPGDLEWSDPMGDGNGD